MEASPQKPRRRWFQFRLRTLLIVTTIIAIALGWWSHKARQQREAVAALREAAGASFEYDTTLPWTSWMKNPPQWPQSLLDKVGVDYFANVVEVYWHSCTDADLEHLKGLTSLTKLDISDSDITDAALANFKELTSLTELDLGGTHVTDAGLERIENLTSLQELNLYDTKTTDAGLIHLKNLTRLTSLNICSEQITDVGLEHIKGLTNLKELDLYNTKITDAGLHHLNGLTALEYLRLDNTHITDKGLENLKSLSAMKELSLPAAVTDAGMARLRQSLPPPCVISH